jgi:hypothetical protein
MIAAVLHTLSDLSDNALYMVYIPLLLTNFAVAGMYGLWAYRMRQEKAPILWHLVLGIGVQFFFGAFENLCVSYYRFFGDYRDWGHNYPLLLFIKLGYMTAGGLHIYGYLKASGRRKWFWRLLFLMPIIVALQAIFGLGVYGDLSPQASWHR